MTQEFIKRVRREGIVDTKNFRYVGGEDGDHFSIKRIPVDLVGYTACLDKENWETVYVETGDEKKSEDGWRKICGHMMYVVDGMVKWGIDGLKTVYPYRPCKTGGWYCDQTMSVSAFRSAWRRDNVNLW